MNPRARRARVVALFAGSCCVALALIVLVGNEFRAAHAVDAWDGMGGMPLDLGELKDRAPAEADGKLVRITGVTRVAQAAEDAEFALQAQAPMLSRHVEMLQWHESTAADGTPLYNVRWRADVIDSARFRVQRGHENPGAFPFRARRFESRAVRLGPFGFAPALVRAIPGSAALPVSPRNLPANLAASLKADGDGLGTADDPASARVGDLRIRWSIVPNQRVTVLARVSQGRLEPEPRLPDPGFVMMLGDASLMELLPGAPRAPAHVGLRRGIAVVFAVLGAGLILAGLRRGRRVDVQSVVAAAVVPLALVFLFAWWGTRAGIVVAALLVLAASMALLVVRLRRA